MLINSLRNADSQKLLNETLTIGIVVDTNDPQQMGRIRVKCPAWGDLDDKPNSDIPFALYASPFGGQLRTMARGPEGNQTRGATSYGMWAIPAVGAQVIVACIDGNPEQRIWLGCVYGQFLTHTLPHGRYLRDGDSGPLTSEETTIEPLYGNQATAFSSNGGRSSEEWQSRAADTQAGAINAAIQNQTISGTIDDASQGYTTNQVDSRLGNDSHTYSITTPGFHAISMDDRASNCRVRIRTTKGHQIILDDTNERMYINTAKGNNWIELDENGNIDVYSSKRVSVHAEEDINFTADGAFRVHANGIHLYSSGEYRVHAANDISIKSGANLRLQSTNDTYLEAGTNLYTKATGIFAEATANIDINAGTTLHLTGKVDASLFSTTGIAFVKGVTAQIQGAPPIPSLPSKESDAKDAYWTNRVPEHEGWARGMKTGTDNDSGNTHTDELSYSSTDVGRVELGETISRNTNWRR